MDAPGGERLGDLAVLRVLRAEDDDVQLLLVEHLVVIRVHPRDAGPLCAYRMFAGRLAGFCAVVGTLGTVSAQATHSTLGRAVNGSIRSLTCIWAKPSTPSR